LNPIKLLDEEQLQLTSRPIQLL